MLMVGILLRYKVMLIRIPSARMGGLCVGIFSSLQGWLCVGVLCGLQCAKNCVGSGGKVMDVYICAGCRNRVTYNRLIAPALSIL